MRYRWIILCTCCLISLYISGTIQIGFTSIIEPLVNEFGWSYTQVSIAASLRGLEAGLLVPVAGLILDRWGPHRLIFGGAIIAGAGLILLSRVNTLVMFYTCFIFLAIGISFAATNLLMAIVSRWFTKNAGMAMGIAASGVAFGGLLLPLITNAIDVFGWRQAVFVMGLGMWFFLLPLSFFMRREPPHNRRRQLNKENNVSDVCYSLRNTQTTREFYFSLFRNRNFWVIAGTLSCHVLTVNSIMTHIMPYLGSINYDRTIASYIASSIPMLTIIGRIGFGWMADRFNNHHVAIAAFVITAAAAAILGFANGQHMWVIVLVAILLGIGWGGGVPMTSCLVIEYFGKDRIGSILGIMGGLMTFGTVIGAPLAGWFFDHMKDYAPAWFVISAILSSATILFIWLLPTSLHKNQFNTITP